MQDNIKSHEYRVVSNVDILRFETVVNDHINAGWLLKGNLVVSPAYNDSHLYSQALIKSAGDE